MHSGPCSRQAFPLPPLDCPREGEAGAGEGPCRAGLSCLARARRAGQNLPEGAAFRVHNFSPRTLGVQSRPEGGSSSCFHQDTEVQRGEVTSIQDPNKEKACPQ